MVAPTEITVTGRLMLDNDSPDIGGVVLFARSTALTHIDGTVHEPIVERAVSGSDGAFELKVSASNDPAWAPLNVPYQVTVKPGSGAKPWGFVVYLPYTDEAVTFGELSPADPLTPPQIYALVNHSHGGGGGPVQWVDVQGKPSTFPPTLPIAQSGVTNLTDDLAARPTSTAVNTALGGKLDKAGGTITGNLAVTGNASIDGFTGIGELQVYNNLTVDGLINGAEFPGGGGGGGVTPTFARARVVSGDITPTTHASMTPLTGGPILAIAAAIGDTLDLHVDCLIDIGAGVPANFYDLAIVNGSTIVRLASTGTSSEPVGGEGDPPMYPSDNVRFRGTSVHWNLAVQASDIVGGNVTFALAHKGSGAGKVYASAEFPFRWSVGNFKQ